MTIAQEISPRTESPDHRLHQNNVAFPGFGPHLLQQRHLAGAEEYLRVTETVFILIADKIAHNVRAWNALVIVALAGIAQQEVPIVEVFVRPAGRKTGRRYANCFEDTAGS